MQAEVIAVGDELTCGQRLDTNSQWLSEQLGQLGIRVLFHTTVGDEQPAIAAVFRTACERADVVLCTGGLGPTADDLTRQALADATSRDLVQDDAALAHIQDLFARRKRPMPQRNVIQAMFPEGSCMIPNPHGSAPGIALQIPRPPRPPCRVFALPGVPAEMREMWTQTVQPALRHLPSGGQQVIRHRRIKCFGVGESDLEQMLPDLIRRGRHPSVGITVSKATITLRVTASGETPEACFAHMEPTLATIRRCLGTLVFGEEDEELQHVVTRLLDQQQRTLATAEWGPGGLLARWLGQVSQAGRPYRGGLIMRDELALIQAANIASDLVQQYGVHHPRVVEAMATACRERFAADYGLAIGPFPPPMRSPDAEPGQVHFALATCEGVIEESAYFAGHPDILEARSAKQALNLLRLTLLEQSGPSAHGVPSAS